MKLIFCTSCGDVFSLAYREKACSCGKAKGRYTDHVNAVLEGESAVPLGFVNRELIHALRNRPEEGNGLEFTAFVIPKKCKSITYKETEPQ